MIKIGKEENFYRCYHYDKYVIKNIKFYDKNGIIISCGQGWLDYDKEDLNCIELDVDNIPLKRKEDFSINGAFIISRGKNDVLDSLQADLYINANVVNLQFLEFGIKFTSMIFKYYVGKDSVGREFKVNDVVGSLNNDKRYEYQNKIGALSRKITEISSLTEDEYENTIKELQEYGKKYFKERERIDNYSVEDYLRDIENNK